MPMKPNYGQQRAERNRLKSAKAEEKQRQRAERAARRKTGDDAGSADTQDDTEQA